MKGVVPMHLHFNVNEPPRPGYAYVLVLEDPDDPEIWFEVWTTKAPAKYVHSKTFYAFRDRTIPLNAFLLDLKQRGSYPHIEFMAEIDKDAAPAFVKARARARKRRARGGSEED
jgi:hypothetical protein